MSHSDGSEVKAFLEHLYEQKHEVHNECLNKAKEPFKFYTQVSIPELTGLKAANLQELLDPHQNSSRFGYLSSYPPFSPAASIPLPEPPNDFAYWITGILGEEELGEALYSIDTIQYTSIRELRDEIVRTIELYCTTPKITS